MSRKVGFLILLGTLGFIFAGGSNNAFADDNSADDVTLSVEVSCSMTKTLNSEHTKEVALGVYENNIGESTFKTYCNDAGGYAVYAVGYSDNTFGNNTLVPENVPAVNSIATGTATSGNTSNWAMKLSAVSGTYAPTIATGFNDYHAVPDDYTKVVSLTSNTDFSIGSSFKTTYAAYVAQGQIADTYNGVVKYTLVYPASEAAPIESIGQVVYLQDFATLPEDNKAMVINSMKSNTVYTLVDNRDNRTYPIAKLKDGNVWMTENLDLGRTTLSTDLTSANTNVINTISATTFNSWKRTTGLSSYDTGVYFLVDGEDEVSETAYGTLYNYYAASAGTISGNSNTTAASYDICPAGWRLPTGGANGETRAFSKNNLYNSESARMPVTDDGAALALAGKFTVDGLVSHGQSGSYWTTELGYSGSSHRELLSISSSTLSSSNVGRGAGNSIRCILKIPKTISTLVYMQEFRVLSDENMNSVLDSMVEDQQYQLKDSRDEKTYYIAKLKDGNVWMTQNLDLELDSTEYYHATDTDITSTTWRPSQSTYTSSDLTSWVNSYDTPQSYDPGEKYWNGVTRNFSSDNPTNFVADSGDKHYHLGNYYNYLATIAMNSEPTNTVNGTLIDQSICPAGWTLPRSIYGNDSFYALLMNYDTYNGNNYSFNNGTILWNAPFYFVISGYVSSSKIYDVGYNTYFWSSVIDGNYAYDLSFHSTGEVYLSGSNNRRSGNAIRCIARPVTSTIVLTAP